MNRLDRDYQQLLRDIIDYGADKMDRTGTGTKSLFGYTIRHNMKNGFPLLTTKKMAWKSIVTELLWFLKGDTNIKYLVDNGCNIWNGDAYMRYLKAVQSDGYYIEDAVSIEEFIHWIKNDEEFASNWGELGPIYGKQWRDWLNLKWEATDKADPSHPDRPMLKWKLEGIDQIENLINDLKTNPDSRRLMVNAWNVGELDQMVLPPCHYGFQVYTRELSLEERVQLAYKSIESTDGTSAALLWELSCQGKSESEILDALNGSSRNIPIRAISLMWNQRSVDTFLGLPFNIASYGLLLEIIAKAVNMVPDQLIGNLGDVHLYSNHIEQAKEQIDREPFELPALNINTEFWPYEGGECGVGPIDAVKVFESFKDDNFCKCLLEEDIQLVNYQSHPAIKAPLSN